LTYNIQNIGLDIFTSSISLFSVYAYDGASIAEGLREFAPVRPLLPRNRVGRLRELTDETVGVKRIASCRDCSDFRQSTVRIESSTQMWGDHQPAVVRGDGGSDAATCFGGGKELQE
jgi:hypothetical protein